MSQKTLISKTKNFYKTFLLFEAENIIGNKIALSCEEVQTAICYF